MSRAPSTFVMLHRPSGLREPINQQVNYIVEPLPKVLHSVSYMRQPVDIGLTSVSPSTTVPDVTVPHAAPASRFADGVSSGDLAAKEKLAARHVQTTCYNPAVELPDSCDTFGYSVPGVFNDRASPSQDVAIMLLPGNQSTSTLFVTANKGALSLLFDFFRTDKVFDCEKKWLRLDGLEQPLEQIEMDCAAPYAMASAMHLCYWLNDNPEGSPWPPYTVSFDKNTCLSVIQAIDYLSCDRPEGTARLVQAQLWSTIERELVGAVCDCAKFGIFKDEDGGRMLLVSVADYYCNHTCTSSCGSDCCSDGELEFDSIKFDKLVDEMNQDIASLPENSPLRAKFARCCHRALSPCTSRKDAATANRLIDKPSAGFSEDSPATYFPTSPRWMEEGFCDGLAHRDDYGYFVTSEADEESPLADALMEMSAERGSNWFVQSRTYTHPHKAGYRITAVALVKS